MVFFKTLLLKEHPWISSIVSALKLFLNFIFNGSIVDLQCCVSFRCMYSKVIVRYTHKYLFSYIFFFRSFSLVGYYKILNIVPGVIQ